MSKWKEIIIHHSATPADFPICSIRKYHIENKGWDDIGYHFLIQKIRADYEAICGRPLNVAGAHCVGHNSTGIGICLVGNYHEEKPDVMMIEKLIGKCAELCDQYDIPPVNIHAHSDYASTLCPGKNIDLGKVRTAVAAKLAHHKLQERA